METAFRLDQAALARFETAVVRLDAQGTCSYANEAAAQLLGERPGTGWTLADLFPGTGEIERVEAELRKRLHGEASSYFTEFTRRRDGAKVPVSIHAFPLLGEDGAITGSLAFIGDQRLAQARRAMYEALESCRSPHELLARVADALARLLPYAEFRVSTLSRARHHLRRVFSTDPQARDKYPFKWWPLREFLQRTLDAETPRVIDVAALFDDPQYQDMAARDAAVRRYRDSGVTYSLSLPVLSGDRVVALIGIDTHRALPFTADDLALCDRLPLSEAVKMALHHEEEGTLRACLNLIREMGAAGGSVREVAQVLVHSLARHFGWDHVAVFQFDEDRNVFAVLAQASNSGRAVDAGTFVTGPDGVVGQAFAGQAIINIADIASGDPQATGFIRGVEGMVSELAIPIPGDRPRWVLNVESELAGAFADEEIELLRTLLTEAGHILDRLSLLEMRSAVLTAINDAVIETNPCGLIRCINPAGQALLGAASGAELRGRPLQDFLADASLAAAMFATDRFSRRELEMRRCDGATVPVLLSGANLPVSQGGRVFIASDLTYQREVERSDLLKDVFRHASLECRVPLALASGWLGRMAQKKGELAADIDRVLEQIRKADMPLERLLRTADATPAEAAPATVDLHHLFDDVLAQFPECERSSVQARWPALPVRVAGTSEDLRFCLETSLSFALRTRPQDKPVQVDVTLDGGQAMVSVAGDWVPALGSDPTPAIRQRWRRTAASDLALAEDVMEDIVRRAHGSFASELDQELRLSLALPLAPGA